MNERPAPADPLARRLAAIALALSLVALVLAGWSAWQADSELRDLRIAIERAVRAQHAPTLGPPPTLDTED